MQKTALMKGFVRAISDQKHPLQTRLSIILTDFEPNGNKQAIPRTEAEAILRTALNAPLKINFDGKGYAGHVGAIPIGPIVEVAMSEDNGRDVIAGEAVVWSDIHPDVDDHLKKAFASGIGSSWEIYYSDSEIDDNNVEWLKGCVFAGTCIVDVPAYGPNRTRVLAIAETLNKSADDLNKRLNMADEEVITPISDTPAEAADDTAVELRSDISNVLDVLSSIYSGLYTMLDETYEIEQNLATTDMPSMAEQFTSLLSGITKRFDSLKEKAGMADSAIAELDTLKAELARAEAEKAKSEKLLSRKTKLSEAGIELSEAVLAAREEFYMSMTDELFEQYLSDLTAVKGKAQASLRAPIIPEPQSSGITDISTKELAAEITATLKR